MKKKVKKKRLIVLIVYCLSLIVIIAILVFLLLLYKQLLKDKYQVTQQAKMYQILNDGEVDISKEQESLEQLENQLLEKYPNFDVSSIEEELYSKQKQNNSLQLEIDELENTIDSLTSKKNSLNDQYNDIKRQKEEAERLAREAASTYQIEGVITFNQQSKYPTGCESVSLHILLSYYGASPGGDEIIRKLPQGGWLYTKDGTRYGGNPDLEFVGSPYDNQSFGVYAMLST